MAAGKRGFAFGKMGLKLLSIGLYDTESFFSMTNIKYSYPEELVTFFHIQRQEWHEAEDRG